VINGGKMPGKKMTEDSRREQILDAACRIALRDSLAGLSSRAVATEAGISNGLVFFYFRNRQELLLALLDWLLAKTILRQAMERINKASNASFQLSSEIRQAIKQLPANRKWIELFFDYWFMGSRDNAIRRRIRAALKLYRDSYLPLAHAVIDESHERFAGLTAESLADLVTTYIEGCALRLITEPRHYDVDAHADPIAALLKTHKAI
jgi:AcrR family transcriptional regulator